MDGSEKITIEKFQLLKHVDSIIKKNKFGVAPIQELINIIISERNVKSGTVRKMVWELSRDGYLENPLRGCWRLTERGRKLLSKVSIIQEKEGER